MMPIPVPLYVRTPHQYAVDHGLIPADTDIELKVVTCPADTIYIPIMENMGIQYSLDDLSAIQAAGLSSLGSGFCLSTFGTTTTTLGSVGTLSSASTYDEP